MTQSYKFTYVYMVWVDLGLSVRQIIFMSYDTFQHKQDWSYLCRTVLYDVGKCLTIKKSFVV
jgi:hypothetical protein